jgi:hypothetical protein
MTNEQYQAIRERIAEDAEKRRSHVCRFAIRNRSNGETFLRCVSRNSHRVELAGRADRHELVEGFRERGLIAPTAPCACGGCLEAVYPPQRFIRGHNLRIVNARRKARITGDSAA